MAAITLGVTRKQIGALVASGAVERLHPDTYRMTAVAPSREQSLRAALLWAGARSAAAGRSAGEIYGLDGVRAGAPEIVVPRGFRSRCNGLIVRRYTDRDALMVRHPQGFAVTGVEATLAALAHTLDGEALEVACEDARRRRLTSVPALSAYLERFAIAGRPGIRALRCLVDEIDPSDAARSSWR